ncbi:MAG: large conductance mechanosensitive channel protein MscL [Eubacteriaceae bacterium]|nr:large conductance mechanosensitive channel protein MscL [Eubacteriaceae bacterium]
MKEFFKDFKDFIAKGDVMSMAVGIIVGSAFTAIVTALVDNIITPILGIILGGLNFSELAITVGNAHIQYGAFIQAVINFLIVAFVLFCAMRGLNRLKNMALKEKKEEEDKSEELSKEAKLLTEINETLKKSVILPKINNNGQ